jgi:hypothetical protein
MTGTVRMVSDPRAAIERDTFLPRGRISNDTTEPGMSTIRYNWNDGDVDHVFDMVHVEGTNGCPYGFGVDDAVRSIEVQSFFIATVPVTQALWAHVMGGDNPSVGRGARLPLENVSWDEITPPGGFLHRLNRLLGARVI